MSSIDNRIVAMKFDNGSFQSGVSTTLSALQKLKQGLNFSDSIRGFDKISANANKVDLSGIQQGVDTIASRFSSLEKVATAVIFNITNRIVDSSLRFAKSFTIQPILDGLSEYETNIKSIQTIQANTDAPLKDVNAALAEMNTFSDQTIYNFSEMARNVGTFTAAGVNLKDSIASIKGIANIAALSGSSSEQAASAMYQLSQAIAAGRVGLMDWNSVVNAGMGGKKLQNALAQTAAAMGEIDGKVIDNTKSLKINGQSFRDSISAGKGGTSWLTSDVLVNTLKAMDGRFSKAALAVNGFTGKAAEAKIAQARLNLEQKNGVKYTDEQFASLTKMADASFKSATEAKTFAQVLQVAREVIGSGFATSFGIIIGDLDEAKTLFTGVSNAIGTFVNANSAARNTVLRDWKLLGGRTVLIEAIKNVFVALGSILKPIGQAFRDLFPRKTGGELFFLTFKLREFTEGLKISGETAENLRRTFRGVFAIFSIVGNIIKGLFSVLGTLIGSLSGASGGFLEFTGSIGDWLVKLDAAIEKGDGLTNFFNGLGAVLAAPINLLRELGSLLAKGVGNIDGITAGFEGLGDAIGSAFSSGNVNAASGLLSAGFLGGIFVLIKKMRKKLLGIDFSGGIVKGIKNTFGALTGNLKALQAQIQAKAILRIAIAVGILAASAALLASIKAADLGKALGAITIAFAQLAGAMAVLVKISGSAGFVKMPLMAASLVLLASSLLILSLAVKIFATMSWSELLKGLTGVAGALVIIAGAMRLMPKNMVAQAAALTLIGISLNAIATAVAIMGNLQIETIARGILGLGAALLVIAGAMRLMPKNMVLMGAGLVLVGTALNLVAASLVIMGSMSPETIGKGLFTLAAALVILAVGLKAMGISGLIGAVALRIVAKGLIVLAGALLIMGSMSWGMILKSLVTLAGALILIGAAAAIFAASGITLAMLALGAALLLIGGGLALAGAGFLAFSVGLATLVSVGAAGVKIIVGMLTGLIALIPMAMEAFARGIVAFAVTIGQHAPQFAAAFVALVTSLLNAIIKIAPKIATAFLAVLMNILKVIVTATPKIATAGLKMLIGFLGAIAKNIGKVVKTATDVIVAFLKAIQKAAPRVADEGVKTLIAFINAITKAIKKNDDDLIAAAEELGLAIAQGIAKGIKKGAKLIIDAAKQAAVDAYNAAKKKLGITSPSKAFMYIGEMSMAGMSKGIDDNTGRVTSSIDSLASTALDNMKSSISGLSDLMVMDMDLTPTITPVLDLTNVQANASKIDALIGAGQISAGLSLETASTIGVDSPSNRDTESVAKSNETFSFEQNITSPKPLTAAEIYRNTKSLISLAQDAFDKKNNETP